MKAEQVIQKDEHAIRIESENRKREIQEMQNWLDWFNDLHYVTPISDLATAKEYLKGTSSFHEKAVRNFLQTKQDPLPPNLKPLRESWNISECDEEDFSKGNQHFEFLELNEGELKYSQSVYTDIENRNTIIATPEQAAILAELDRTFENCMKLCEALIAEGWFRKAAVQKFNEAFELILKPSGYGIKDNGNLTRWNLEKLEILAKARFVQKKLLTKK